MVNYTEYQSWDFLADDSFINFLLTRNEVDVRLWKSRIERHPECRPEIDRAIELYYSLQQQQVDQDPLAIKTISNELERFKLLLHSEQPSVYVHPLPVNKKLGAIAWRRVAAAAAVLVLAVFAWNFFTPHPTNQLLLIASTGNEIKKIALPDGTEVILNHHSSVSIPEAYNKTKREVKLTGTAFFSVSKDASRPFVVDAGVLKITALGTAFYVHQQLTGQLTSISLLEGRVGIDGNGEHVELSPGEKAVNNNRQILKSKFSADNLRGWINNKIQFRDASLDEIRNVMEDYFDMRILIKGNPDRISFTGDFDTGNPETILESLRFTYNIRYEKKGNDITLYF